MKLKERPRVLIALALDADGAALLPKLFHDAGAFVTVISPPGYRITRSRYVDRCIRSTQAPAAIVETMRRTMSQIPFDAVIIASDPLLYEIYRSRDIAWIEPYLPVQPHVAGPALASKNTFLELCRSANIDVPPFETCTSLSEALAAADRIGYPVVLKLEEGYAGGSVRRADVSGDIRKLFTEGFIDKPFAVQRCIDGRVGTTSALFRNGEPVYHASAYYERCWPTPFSPPTVRRVTDRPELIDFARKIGALTHYEGFGGIDWIEEGSTGRIYVLELNARPMPMHVIALAMPWYSRALQFLFRGERVPVLPRAGSEGQIYRAFPTDLYRVFNERDVSGLARWLVTMPFAAGVPWDDPRLLTAQLAGVLSYYKRQSHGMLLRAASRLKARFAK